MSGFLLVVLILALFGWAVVASVWAVEAGQRASLERERADIAEDFAVEWLARWRQAGGDEAVKWAALREADAGVRDAGRRWER